MALSHVQTDWSRPRLLVVSTTEQHTDDTARPDSQTNAKNKQAEDVFDMFVDFEGARGEERVDSLMRALGRECNSMLVLDRREVKE